jgi:hypothetical protein
VIKHLRDEGRTSTIALWGRSMGAATALLHGQSVSQMVIVSSLIVSALIVIVCSLFVYCYYIAM